MHALLMKALLMLFIKVILEPIFSVYEVYEKNMYRHLYNLTVKTRHLQENYNKPRFYKPF